VSGFSEHRFDVAVIGCGPAGSAAALALARAGVRTALIGHPPTGDDAIGESLAPSATTLLKRLGLFTAFLTTNPLPCYANRSSWGGRGVLTEHDFIRDRDGNGWHVDRRRFDAMLLQTARDAGACYLGGARLRAVEGGSPSGWRLQFAHEADRTAIRARFAIDASGRASAFARRLGVPRRRLDRLLAAVAFLEPKGESAPDSSTLVEAAGDGWWYSATLPDGRMVAACLTDADLPAARQARSAQGWLALLKETAYTRDRVHENHYCLRAAPRLVAAGNSLLGQCEGPGWLAAGDAAAAYDPLSSHGIGAALAGGMQAAEAARAGLAGESLASATYGEQVARSYARYLLEWHAYYAQETRWPDSPFWRRRHQGFRHVQI
jgi:flavin-dependent dehydrogenase